MSFFIVSNIQICSAIHLKQLSSTQNTFSSPKLESQTSLPKYLWDKSLQRTSSLRRNISNHKWKLLQKANFPQSAGAVHSNGYPRNNQLFHYEDPKGNFSTYFWETSVFWRRWLNYWNMVLAKSKNNTPIKKHNNSQVHKKNQLGVISRNNCSYYTLLTMHSIDFSHLLWLFNLYSWNVHQQSPNKFGNIGTKTNKSMQRNINFALSLFVRQGNHESCKWRSKVLKWVKTLDLQTNTFPIKKGYFKVLSRGIYYQ